MKEDDQRSTKMSKITASGLDIYMRMAGVTETASANSRSSSNISRSNNSNNINNNELYCEIKTVNVTVR